MITRRIADVSELVRWRTCVAGVLSVALVLAGASTGALAVEPAPEPNPAVTSVVPEVPTQGASESQAPVAEPAEMTSIEPAVDEGLAAVGVDVVETFSGTQDLIIETAPGATRSLVRQLKALGVEVTQQYDTVLNGAAVTVTQQQLSAIKATANVESISPDRDVVLFDTTTQDSPTWGLDRIDQADYTPYEDTVRSYTYPSSAGSGVTVFVIDTGFTRQNDELDGRLGIGANFSEDDHGTPGDPSDDTSTKDCNQHGTHVAGTVASTTYGVAKLATIVPVRVFSCSGSTASSTIVAGIEWAVENRPIDAPSVINMSLGGGANLVTDQATQAAIDAGMTVVVSAGNGGADGYPDDACFGGSSSNGGYSDGLSPARVVDAITVGSSGYKFSSYPEPVDYHQDLESPFSNYGTCVDLYAPGGSITSLAFNNPGTLTISGTSMSAPHVAGAAALFLSINPQASPADVQNALVTNASQEKIRRSESFWFQTFPASFPGYPVSRATQTPNLLLNTEFLTSSLGTPESPSDIAADSVTPTSVALLWNEPAVLNSGTVSNYVVQYQEASRQVWSTFFHPVKATPGLTVTGLKAATEYVFRVAAMTSQGTGAFSDVHAVSTASGIPEAPVNPAFVLSPTSAAVTWEEPEVLNGGMVTDYLFQYRESSNPSWLTFANLQPLSPVTGLTLTGLTPGLEYAFQLAAVTAQGTGEFAGSYFLTLPDGLAGPPAALAFGEVTPSSVELVWDASTELNGGTISDYLVQYRDAFSEEWSMFDHAVKATTGLTVTGLTQLTEYQFQIATSTEYGTGVFGSVESTTTVHGPTSAPLSLAAGVATRTSVPLTWVVPSDLHGLMVANYLVQYRVAGTTLWSTFDRDPSEETNVTVTGLTSATSYQFQIAAQSSEGDSAFTSIVARSTLAPPTSSPRSLSVGTATVSSVLLAWKSPLTVNGKKVTDYLVKYRVAGDPSWSTFAHTASTKTTRAVTGLSAGTSYEFRVAAITAQGASDFVTVSKATLSGVASVPRSFVSSTVTPSSVLLKWKSPSTANGGRISDYLVEYRVAGDPSWSTFAHTASTKTTRAVTGLSAGTSYEFRIAARTAQGDSAVTAVISRTTR
jgi:subtilisin family serine protease